MELQFMLSDASPAKHRIACSSEFKCLTLAKVWDLVQF